MRRNVSDIDKLREDLIDLLGTAMIEVSGAASIDLNRVYKASPDELVEIATEYGLNVSDYNIEEER